MRRIGATFVALAATAFVVGASAQSRKADAPESARTHDARGVAAPAAESKQYCAEISATAAAARNARQEKELMELEQRIAQRTADLEAKRAELLEIVERHEALAKKADERLIAIYARMRPDAAASQLADMEEEVAAAMLMRLQPKQSSAILNEMEAARAVALTKKVAALTTFATASRKP
jgi:flagellar motility protein MotE (MotC chaperone)